MHFYSFCQAVKVNRILVKLIAAKIEVSLKKAEAITLGPLDLLSLLQGQQQEEAKHTEPSRTSLVSLLGSSFSEQIASCLIAHGETSCCQLMTRVIMTLSQSVILATYCSFNAMVVRHIIRSYWLVHLSSVDIRTRAHFSVCFLHLLNWLTLFNSEINVSGLDDVHCVF